MQNILRPMRRSAVNGAHAPESSSPGFCPISKRLPATADALGAEGWDA